MKKENEMINTENMLKVYFIAGTQDCIHIGKNPQENLLFILENALKNGITCFQFREKGKNSLKDKEEIITLAKQCQNLCKKYKVPFFINDDVNLALEIKADGIHIGQDDKNINEVIKQVQGKALIGLSTNTLEQVIKVQNIKEIDYFGVGPIFPTTSKKDAKKEVGLDLLKNIRAKNISKPLVAIGGIDEKSVKKVLESGANGVASISSLTKSKNIEETIDKLKGK